MFEGRTLLIATKHAKERVIAPVLQQALGVRCQVTNNFNTDQFGTFSGEVVRSLSPIETLREKCITALHEYQTDLVVASEGSFGSHPSLFFVPADDELIMLKGTKNNLEIIAREVSTETCFDKQNVTAWNELEQFALRCGFPSHAIILKDRETDFQQVIKGINRWERLKEGYESLIINSEAIHAETDMRACYNPTRMKVIERAAVRLVEKIQSTCPQCNMPGFEVHQLVAGLPCNDCGAPTRSPVAEMYLCKHCLYSLEKKFPKGKMKEDPTYCDYCNP
jgi:hypothetical protein